MRGKIDIVSKCLKLCREISESVSETISLGVHGRTNCGKLELVVYLYGWIFFSVSSLDCK